MLAYPHAIVIVNGVTLAKDSEVLAVKAGQEIRFPIEAKGRCAPIVQEKWLNAFTIGLITSPPEDQNEKNTFNTLCFGTYFQWLQ